MKRIFTLAIMLGALLSSHAEDKFYYSGDKKIALKEQAGKEVVIVPATTPENQINAMLSNSPEVRSDRVIVYRVTSNEVAGLKARKGLSAPIIVEKTYTDPQGLELIPTGYFNVCLKKEEDFDVLEKRAEEFGLQVTRQDEFMPLWYELVVTFLNVNSVIDIANQLYETGEFRSCSPAFSFYPFEISYDPDVYKKWELYNPDYEGIDVNVVPAWDYATGKGVKIAIIDSGVDLHHRDLAPNIHSSYDGVTGQSPATMTCDAHATHVAGIAAAVRNNGIQVAGVAPDAKIMSARWADGDPNVVYQMSAGINWAWKNGADIISCSFQCPQSENIEEAIDSAVTIGRGGKGCVFVKSAGNTTGTITYPGSYRKEVIAVGALQRNGNKRLRSAHGDNLLLMAPGDTILSTLPNDEIGEFSGTSMACPHVSGVAALILERNPNLTAEQVRGILAKSTKKIGDRSYNKRKEFGWWNEHYGYGLIDAYKAVMNTPRKN